MQFIKLNDRFYNVDLIRSFWLEPNILDGGRMLIVQMKDGYMEKVIRSEGVTTFEKLATMGGGKQ